MIKLNSLFYKHLSLQMDEFMNRRYEFRYNTQIGEVEYRERFSFQFYFHTLANRVPCNNPNWELLFHGWFLNMVSH